MNALQLQQTFDFLQEALLYLRHSPRNQVHQIVRWIAAVGTYPEPGQLRSYVREVLPRLCPLISSIPAAGTPLPFLSGIAEALDWLCSSYPDLCVREDIPTCRHALRTRTRNVLAYLGEPARGDGRVGDHLFHIDRGSSPREILVQYMIDTERRGVGPEPELVSIAESWDGLVRDEVGTANVPLLEQDITNGIIEDFQPFVTFERVRVMAVRQSAQAGPIETGSWPEHRRNAMELTEQLGITREIIDRIAHRHIVARNDGAFDFITSLEVEPMYRCGRSYGLALGLAHFSAIANVAWDPRAFIPLGSSIYTGAIAEDGSVPSLAAAVLERKIAGTVFSPFQTLAIPKSDIFVAERAIADHTSQFQYRNLRVVGLEYMEDALQHRQLVEIRVLPLKSRLAKSWSRYQKTISIGSLSLLILSILAYFFLLADFDVNPHSIVRQANEFRIVNRNGKLLWKQWIKYPYGQSVDTLTGNSFHRIVSTSIADLDGDGLSEVLLSHPDRRPGFSDSLFCFAHDGSPRWSAPIGMGIRTREGRYPRNGTEAVEAVVVLPGGDGRESRILAVSENGFYTDVVHAFDVHGHEIERYLHLGMIAQPELLTDLLCEGPAIMLAGTLNGYLRPVFVVLDPYRLRGTSPQKESHRLLEPVLPPGEEIYYLLFPELDVASHRFSWYIPMARIVSVDNKQIRVEVSYGINTSNIDYADEVISLIFVLDAHTLEPLTVNTTTPFELRHARLRSQGLIHSTIDSAYKADIMSRIEYWDGYRFVEHPTRNLRYRGKLKYVAGR